MKVAALIKFFRPPPSPRDLPPVYNHDLNVSDGFLAGFPGLASAFKDERLLKEFGFYEDLAKEYKKKFHAVGLWSVIFGTFPLFVASLHLALGEKSFDHISNLGTLAGICGAVSLFLLCVLRVKRYQKLWCQAVFCRERIRQWHFQQFLDGRLICLLKSDEASFNKERDSRWNSLLQNFQDGYGLMAEYISDSSEGTDFMVEPSDYPDLEVFESVVSALKIIRFEHQLRYSIRKTAPDGEPVGLALHERTSISESVASIALAGAVVTTVLAFILPLGEYIPHGFGFAIPIASGGRVLDGLALGLAVLSAGSRAYRSGYTLPDESESFEEYCDNIREARAIFVHSPDSKEKLRQLEALEYEAAAELRRFLRMKTRATFLS